MKIAFIGQKGIPVSSGGVERRVQELSTRMVKMGHEVFVYARKDYIPEKISEYKGVKIIYLPSIATKNLGTITHTFLAILHAAFRGYDVIHFQAPGPSSLCWMVKLLIPKTTLVATFNSRDDQHQKWGKIARAYLKFGEWVISKVPDRTIVVSEILRDYVKEKFNKNAIVIHNGSAVKISQNEDGIKKWNLEKDRYFLSVCRLVRHKGIHYLINAFKKAQKEGNVPADFKLVIVGDSAFTDDYVSYLKEISKGDKNIIFTGTQFGETLAELFSNAFAFVQPSEAEGLSNALLEAVGYGKPVIISDIIENIAVIKEDGLTFKNKDEEDLEEKMIFALKNIELIKKLSQAAKLRIEKEYSWDANASRTLELYRDLILDRNIGKIVASYSARRLS